MNEKAAPIPAAEVLAILRAGIHRALPLAILSTEPWGAYPYFDFSIGGWNFSVFEDAGDFDYIETVLAPDGRSGQFADWDPSPENYLTDEERATLERMLGVTG